MTKRGYSYGPPYSHHKYKVHLVQPGTARTYCAQTGQRHLTHKVASCTCLTCLSISQAEIDRVPARVEAKALMNEHNIRLNKCMSVINV